MKVGNIIICLSLLLFGCSQQQKPIGKSPYFVRGVLLEEPFPENKEAWRLLIKTCKEYGFNYMKSVTGEMPDEAFEVSGELDFYIGTDSLPLVECSVEDGGYPDVDKPSFEQTRKSLQEQAMEGLADDFVFSCGRAQIFRLKRRLETECYVEGKRGFLLRGWRDCPKKGKVGILNEDGTEKKYISAGEFRCFCGPVVVLFPMKKQVFTNDETLEGELKIINMTDSLMSHCDVEWRIKDRLGKTWQADTLETTDIAARSKKLLGKLTIPLKDFERPVQLSLEVRAGECYNSWDFVVYPEEQFLIGNTNDIRMAARLDKTALDFLKAGGKLLLAPEAEQIVTRKKRNLVCNPVHPAFGLFPVFPYTTSEWEEVLPYTMAIDLTGSQGNYRPIVRLIDEPERNRSLALLLEARMGKGKILLSGCDFTTDMEHRLAGRQLLCSLKSYMASELFAPSVEISDEELKRLFASVGKD